MPEENISEIIQRALDIILSGQGKRLYYVKYVGSSRGVDVAKVTDGKNLYSLKVIDHESIKNHSEFDPEFRIESIQREGQILQRLSSLKIGGYFLHGTRSNVSWLLTRWIEGKSASDLAREMRGDKSNDKRFLSLFSEIIRPVALLHRNGFLHGDLQPSHFIFTKEGIIELIDFGLARAVSDNAAPYKGGLVHFNAPEVARQMLRKQNKVDYDIKSEIYSLGAVLFVLYTGKAPVYYGSEAIKEIPFDTKLNMIAQGRLRSFKDCSVLPCLPIERFLQRFLAYNREERYQSLDEALNHLEEIFLDFDHLISGNNIDSENDLWGKKLLALKDSLHSRKVKVLLFDLDGTLYPSTTGLEYQIKPRMVETCADRIGIDRKAAQQLLAEYRNKYGASVIGLERHHNIDGKEFLEEVFRSLDLSAIQVNPLLKDQLLLLAAHTRPVLLTNSSLGHAHRILDILGIKEAFSLILAVENAGFIRKPHPLAYEKLFPHLDVCPSDVLVFDDSYLNLQAAQAMGMMTVLVSNGIATPPQFWEMHKRVFHDAPSYVDARTHNLSEFIGDLLY